MTAGLPAVCDYWQSSPLTCRFGRFQPGSGRVEFSAGFVAPHGGPAYVDVVVTSLNDYTPENNRYRFEFVVPDVRFVLESAVASRNAVKRSEVFEIDWLLVNEGQIPASGVVADFGVDEQTYEFLGVQTANGTTCSRDPVVFHHWLCPIGAVAPGATLALKLRLRAREFPDMAPGGFASGFIDLTLTAAEPIFNFANHWQGPRVSVASRISDLYAAMAPATAAEAGSKATLRLHGGNHGPDAVEGAELYVRTPGGFTFDAATSSSGTCATERGEMTCRLGTLPSGNTFDVVMDITVGAGSGDHEVLYQLDGGSFTYDSDPTNQAGGVDFTSVAAAPPPRVVTPAPAPAAPAPAAGGGGGGGGAVDGVLLLLLLGSVTWRLSRVRDRYCRGAASPARPDSAGAPSRAPPSLTNSTCAFATFKKNLCSASANSGALPWPVACDISWPFSSVIASVELRSRADTCRDSARARREAARSPCAPQCAVRGVSWPFWRSTSAVAFRLASSSN